MSAIITNAQFEGQGGTFFYSRSKFFLQRTFSYSTYKNIQKYLPCYCFSITFPVVDLYCIISRVVFTNMRNILYILFCIWTVKSRAILHTLGCISSMYAVESRVVFLNMGNTVPIVIYSVKSRIVITNIRNTFPVMHLCTLCKVLHCLPIWRINFTLCICYVKSRVLLIDMINTLFTVHPHCKK
jgi:hypothetical protein